jgi:ketosteroid isomerase-like protein
MSQENVEFVRSVYAMLDAGDAEPWDLLPSDFVFDFSRRLMDPVVLRGANQAGAFYRDLTEAWAEGPRVGVEELIDAGDKVLVLIRFGGRGKMSGADVEARVWNLWTFRDGEPVAWTYFGDDRAAAFEAAGLSG